MDIETVSESYINFLESQGIASFGTDLFLNQAPYESENALYWVITSGGNVIQKLKTGEKVKQYFVSTYYRSTIGKDVERNLFKLEELLNDSNCVELDGFELVEIEATQFASDSDLDNEERRVGFVQASIQIYQKPALIV